MNTLTRVFTSMLLALTLVIAVVPPTRASAAPQAAIATGFANVRAAPSTAAAIVDVLEPGDRFTVVSTVVGEEVSPGNSLWYRSSFGNYVYSGVATTSGDRATSASRGAGGRRIEVDRGARIARAIENGRVVYTAPVTVGQPGWETPLGTFRILRRVANETMDSSTIGIPQGTPGSYYLRNVLYTQYITNDGVALHYNYWVPASAFGSAASSRGCVGLRLADARFFWSFAGVGTPVVIYE